MRQHTAFPLKNVPSYPVVDLTVPDGVVDAIAGASCGREGFVTDEKVQVLSTTLPRQVATRSSTASQKRRLVCNCWATGAGSAAAACWAACGYGGGEDEGGGVVAGETWGMLLLHAHASVDVDVHTELRVSRTAAGVRQYSIAMQGPTGSWELTCP